MLNETALAKEIVNWKQQLGEQINNRMCIPIDSGIRQDMFKTLIETLKIRYTLKEDDFDHPMFLRLILQASVNPKSPNRRGWSEAVTEDWARALADKFPRELIMHDSSTELPKVQRPKYDRNTSGVEYTKEDHRLAVDNPIDPSIFEGLPPVNDPVNEDFLEMLRKVKDE